MTIHNQLGITIEALLQERRNAGSHAITYTATNLPSGFTFYKLNNTKRNND